MYSLLTLPAELRARYEVKSLTDTIKIAVFGQRKSPAHVPELATRYAASWSCAPAGQRLRPVVHSLPAYGPKTKTIGACQNRSARPVAPAITIASVIALIPRYTTPHAKMTASGHHRIRSIPDPVKNLLLGILSLPNDRIKMPP